MRLDAGQGNVAAMSRDDIIEYARSRGLAVTRENDAHSIVADAAPYRVEVTVPDTVYEWFITVKDGAQREVFTDWCEHYETEGGQNLEAEMAGEIIGFLSLIGPGRVRVHAPRTDAARLEVSYQGEWLDPWQITDDPTAPS